MNVDSAILRLFRVLEDCSCSFSDAGKRSSAEDALTTVEQINLLALDTADEADFQAPVEKGPVQDDSIRQTASICFLLQSVLHLDLVRVDGQLTSLVVESVGAEFRGKEALDASFCGCFDKEQLLR